MSTRTAAFWKSSRVSEGCFELGSRVEVSWPIGCGSGSTVRWWPVVLGVHQNKQYVVRFERGGDWG